jgi:hypothetical protein
MSLQQKPAEAHVERKRWIELSVPQLLAGALAAASAAVAASWLGVAGTVLGAVVASIVVTVSSALYARPIERSSQVIRESLPVIPVLPDRYRERDATSTETRVLGATSVDELDRVESATVEAVPAGSDRGPARRIQWSATVLTLVVGFGILTAFEALIGKSASSLTGGGGGGSTIARIVESDNGSSSSDNDKPTGPTQPEETDDDSTEPAPTDPTLTEPTEPGPTDPEPTDPEPTDPTITEPTPTSPTATDPGDSTPEGEDGAQDGAGATVATDPA